MAEQSFAWVLIVQTEQTLGVFVVSDTRKVSGDKGVHSKAQWGWSAERDDNRHQGTQAGGCVRCFSFLAALLNQIE